jgi:DnaJ-class molecular chaperone
MACSNCGGTGWHAWRPQRTTDGRRVLVWVACADCNDDERMLKPELCEGCGDTQPFCRCEVT